MTGMSESNIELSVTASAAEYHRNTEALLRLIRDRGRYLPDFQRTSTQGNIPTGRDTQVAPHPMRGLGTNFVRSRPAVRAAFKRLFPTAGMSVVGSEQPFVTGTRRTREG